MDNFNFKKYLTENRLGSFGRFNGYTDLQPVNEDGSWHPDDPSAPNDDKEYCDGCDMPKEKCVCDQLEEEDQDMNITTKPTKIYATNEDWMNDNINGERYDDWVALWDEIPGIICWSHNQLPTEKLYIAITPGWDGPGTPMETIFNAGDDFGEFDSIEEYEFNSFQAYLNAVKFYLDKIDENIHDNKYKINYNISLDDQKTDGQNTHGNDREFNYDDKVYEGAEENSEVTLKDLNYNLVTTPFELEKTWKDMYGEDFQKEYPGAYSYLDQNYKNFNILDLGSVWERMYGEDILDKYPAIAKWLFSNEGRQSSKDKVVPKNGKVYEMGSETLSQEEADTNDYGASKIKDPEQKQHIVYNGAAQDFRDGIANMLKAGFEIEDITDLFNVSLDELT